MSEIREQMNEVWSTEQGDGSDQAQSPVTLDQLKQLVSDLRELKDLKKSLEDSIDELSPKILKVERDILSALKSSDLQNFKVPEIGMVYISRTESYAIPKTVEDKLKVFGYIKEKYGQETLDNMASIHSATLNKFANEESSNGVMQIPGLGLPTLTERINMRRA